MQKWKSSLGVVLLSVGMAFVVGGCMSEQTQGQASEQAPQLTQAEVILYAIVEHLQKICKYILTHDRKKARLFGENKAENLTK